MTLEEREALCSFYLGKTVEVKIDRPLGFVHDKHGSAMAYPINYGCIPNVIGGDGEELDVYVLGIDEPIEKCTVKIIGAVHRLNDSEDKLVGCPEGMSFDQAQIAEATFFQEKYYETYIESIYQKSCGTLLFTKVNGEIRYLLIENRTGYCGFPKGHTEKGETEIQTALRETWEETSIKATVIDGFVREAVYNINKNKIKRVIYYLASYENQTPSHNEGFESNSFHLLPYNEAYNRLSYGNMKTILRQANDFLTK